MADDTKKPTAPGPREVAGRLMVKLLTPLVATVASAAAGYAAKKAPALLDEHLGPRLRGAKDDVADLPARAKSAAGGAGDLATGLAERARAAAGGAVPWGDDDSDGESNGRVRSLSQDELAHRRAERAARRDGRRRNRSRT
jgi:hypothetical protein